MSRYFLGFLVIAFGFILLLNNFGLAKVNLGNLIGTYWPLVLVLWGINHLTAPFKQSSYQGVKVESKFRSGDLISGILLVTIGLLLILRNMGLYLGDLSFLWKLFWPVIIISVGIILLKGTRPNSEGKNHAAIMGGIELGKNSTWNLKSDSYWAVMGGIERSN